MVAVNIRKRPASLEHSNGYQSTSPSIQDEGELMSEEASECWSGGSSEEGEIQSEIEEVDVSPGATSLKEETPWERGLRLARERIEKAKVVRAAEKDLMEKRMTLPVVEPVVTTVVENAEEFVEDMFWPCYYQPSIIGHTELTSRRYLPEDLLAPSKERTLAWRRSLRAPDRKRTSRYSPTSSRSGSASSQASRLSHHRSSSTVSFDSASSIVSIAESWKASCARALRDYLGSPTHGGPGGRGKARRYGGGRRRDGRGRSSSTGNSSSSGSSQSGNRRRRRYIYTGGIARIKPSVSGRTGISPSSRSSSDSGRGDQLWKANRGAGRLGRDRRRRGSGGGSESPESATRPLPLPHERPVKRPWVADPSLASVDNVTARNLRTSPRAGSSRSGSGSPLAGDEKQYITSWSRSPSSGNERRPIWHRRERLPDVVPGAYAERVRRGVTPSRRRTSRSPFAGDAVTRLPTASELTSGPRLDSGQGAGRPGNSLLHQQSAAVAIGDAAGVQPGKGGASTAAGEGALPLASSRPGVRMTLAPRLKSSGLAAASLAGATSRATATNRQVFAASPPPVARQLPPPSTASPTSLETPRPLSPTQIRMQAEAMAAVVEAREKRRAAAEAARRQRNPNRQRRKHPDLSTIPPRGRPTYRRMSFSSQSSYGSSRSSASASSATSRSGSRGDGRQQMGRHPVAESERPRLSKRAWPVDQMQQQQMRKRHSRGQQLAVDGGYGGQMGGAPVGYEQASGGDYGRTVGGRLGMMPSDYGPRSRKHNNRQGDRFDFDSGPPSHRPAPEPMRNYEMGYFDQDADLAMSHHDQDNYRMKGSRQQMDSSVRFPGSGRYDGRRLGMGRPRGNYHHQQQMEQQQPRAARPGTPHATPTYPGANRSPHSMPVQANAAVGSRQHPRGKVDFNDGGIPMPTGRKRVVIDAMDDYAGAVDIKRARSRHRSRGPGGAPIDRSEPFESDAGNTFAAEQRLRQLRERLNFVDDAIAEIKASGAGVGYSSSRK